MKKYIVAILLLSFSFNQEIFSGYLRSTEASFCMDECGMFYVESEYDSGTVQTEYPLYFDEDIEFESYLNRFVEVTVSDDEVNCIECSALRVLYVQDEIADEYWDYLNEALQEYTVGDANLPKVDLSNVTFPCID